MGSLPDVQYLQKNGKRPVGVSVYVEVVWCHNVSSNVGTCFISNIAPWATNETDADNDRTHEISFADKKVFPVFVNKYWNTVMSHRWELLNYEFKPSRYNGQQWQMNHRFHETYWSAGGFITSHVGQNKQEVCGCCRWAFDQTHTGKEMHVTLEEPSADRGAHLAATGGSLTSQSVLVFIKPWRNKRWCNLER